MKTRQWAVLMLAALVALLAACGPGAAPSLTLDATYNAGGLAFNYPRDWLVGARPGSTVLANTPTALQVATAPGSSTDFKTGEVAVSFVPLPEEVVASVDEVSPVAVLQAFLPQLDTGSDFPAFGAVTAVTLGARSAAQASGSSEQNDGRAIVIDINGAYMLVVAVSPEGEMNDYNATIDAILASLSYTPPADDGS